MLKIISNIIAFTFTLSILITIHELGHFLAARLCGIKVEKFSIGFGKVLWGFKSKKNIHYTISLIPIGGYVKINDKNFDKKKCKKSFFKRFFIIFSGPIANFLLSIFLYFLIFMHGTYSVRPIVGGIIENSIAEKANILPSMEIKQVDQTLVRDWESFKNIFLKKIHQKEIILKLYLHDSNTLVERKISFLSMLKFKDEDPLFSLGIVPYLGDIFPILIKIQKNSPASKAGLKIGDEIKKINNKKFTSWYDFSKFILQNAQKKVFLTINRDNKIIHLPIIPQKNFSQSGKGFIGVIPKITWNEENYKALHQNSLLNAFNKAIKKTGELIFLIIKLLFELIQGNVKISNLGGPVSIAKGAILSANYGFFAYLAFLALISINLGVVNLLPLPTLDGGHLFFLILEKIKGNPISQHIQNLSYRIGFIILIILMGIALLNDFSRL